jgi:hypothetical protein
MREPSIIARMTAPGASVALSALLFSAIGFSQSQFSIPRKSGYVKRPVESFLLHAADIAVMP